MATGFQVEVRPLDGSRHRHLRKRRVEETLVPPPGTYVCVSSDTDLAAVHSVVLEFDPSEVGVNALVRCHSLTVATAAEADRLEEEARARYGWESLSPSGQWR